MQAALLELRQTVQTLEADKEQLARTAAADQDRLLRLEDDLSANDFQLAKLQDQLEKVKKVSLLHIFSEGQRVVGRVNGSKGGKV